MSEIIYRTTKEFREQHPELVDESQRRKDESAKRLHDEKIARRNARRLTDRTVHQAKLANLSRKLAEVLHALEQYPTDLKNSDCEHVARIRGQADQILAVMQLQGKFSLEPAYISPRKHKTPYGYVYDHEVERWRRNDL